RTDADNGGGPGGRARGRLAPFPNVSKPPPKQAKRSGEVVNLTPPPVGNPLLIPELAYDRIRFYSAYADRARARPGRLPQTGAAVTRAGRTYLHHLAIGTERWADGYPALVQGLGGRWSLGGDTGEYAPCQL